MKIDIPLNKKTNIILVAQHFCLSGHSFKRNARFTIKERIWKYTNIKMNKVKREDKWRKYFQIYSGPSGFNMELNELNKKKTKKTNQPYTEQPHRESI